MRRPSNQATEICLRAGMPKTVDAEIGSGLWVVGTISLRAIADIVTNGRSLHGYRAVIDITVVIITITGRVVARTIGVALRGNGAADHGTSHGARDETTPATLTVITATAAAINAATAAAVLRAGRSAATCAKTAATIESRDRRAASAATWACRLLEAGRSLGDAFTRQCQRCRS